MRTEPAFTLGMITAAATSVIALLVAFGLDINQDQQAAILGAIAGVGPLVAALLIRRKVTPAGKE